MQLINWVFVFLIWQLSVCHLAAQTDARYQKKDSIEIQDKKLQEVEVNILFGYYDQDGNNSPVTGGVGTEKLTDYAPKISVQVPLGEKHKIGLSGGFDTYTSASTDNIDDHVSSASVIDTRIYGNLEYTRLNDEKNTTWDVSVGGSTEYDYNSVQFGAGFSKGFNDDNTMLSFSGGGMFDRWGLYYPEELRGRGPLVDTDQRRSFNVGMSVAQILTRRLQASFTVEGVYQSGLLSTPFHRVYFQEQSRAKLERLPGTRMKVPASVRLNYYPADFLIIKTFYRFYWDDWGATAHTASIELPVKINRFFSVYPFYRFHTQTAADYFKPYKEHDLTQDFYTSDYDLAALQSHNFGFGIHFAPLNGLARIKVPFVEKRKIVFKGVDLRYSHYRRNTGLRANNVSLGLKFVF